MAAKSRSGPAQIGFIEPAAYDQDGGLHVLDIGREGALLPPVLVRVRVRTSAVPIRMAPVAEAFGRGLREAEARKYSYVSCVP